MSISTNSDFSDFDWESLSKPDKELPPPPFADEYLTMSKTRNVIGHGEKYEFSYPNGYGASVIRGKFSYGGPELYELAVLKNGRMCYDTPLAADVIGYLTAEEVRNYLDQIKAL